MRALALAGPTASGKSDFAPALAAALNGEIISVDSGAVYREMNIGTAKPPPAVRAQTPHHLIDVANPDENFNAGKFCRLAAAALTEITARGKLPIFAGGAMMYFHAFSRGLHDFPPPSMPLRAKLREELRRLGAPAMHRRLAQLDPAAAAKIAPSDSQRIARALEIIGAANAPLSQLQSRPKTSPPDISFILLMPADRAQLRRAIDSRLQNMFAEGLVKETETAAKKYNLAPDSPPLRMAGYRQAAAFLRGETDEEEMKKRAYYATCQLAKRQMTWLKKWQPAPNFIDPFALEAEKKIMKAAQNFCG
ncbi:MAG: tRNA (adenosine(37)-N6)-dimethylallyltransferase MiaA [Gammaproteobacteria bacterium]